MHMKRIVNFLHYILGMIFNLAIVIVVGIAVYVMTVQGFNFGEAMAYDFAYTGQDEEVVFVLTEETAATEVSRRLEEMGVINNSNLFNLELFLMGRVRTYQPGTYILNRNMSNTDVHQVLRGSFQGHAPHEEVRIIEGWTIQDMANYFESRGFFTAEEFVYVATYGHFNFGFISNIPQRSNGLEGYLFPDTYQVPLNPTPGDIIWRMLMRFEEVFDLELQEQADAMGLTMDEVVIMASIIESETRVASERPKVAQVIQNRLELGMYLGLCSTVAYVLDVHRDRLLLADLEIDSPFNTYRNLGLPLGPISSPGAAALRAVVNPSGCDSLFFVLYNFETGEHYFSTTYAEHQAADARARARG